MKNITVIRYRIYPTKKQAKLINETFGCCRKIWNLMLNDWESSYKETGKTTYTTPAKYKDEYPYLRNVDSLALANVQLNLQQAYKLFFEKKCRHPRFKSSKNRAKSYRTNRVKNNIRIENTSIRLPKLGEVKAILHRLPNDAWILKHVTVLQDTDDKYYASVLFEYDSPEISYAIDPTKAIGLDYKSDGLYVDSEGNIGSTHKYLTESKKKLSRAQRRLSRKKLGSKNREKQRKKAAKIIKHITNQRKDNLHKISRMLVNKYDIICVESLNLNTIAGRLNLGRSTIDNGFGMFRNFIDYKTKNLGKVMVKVDKFYPSTKTCSSCGHIHDISLRDRVYRCPDCGLELDRDINAAINIKNEGLRLFLQTA